MDELLTAIYARYAGANGAALRAIVNGMFLGRAAAKTTAPYIVVTVPSNREDNDSMSTEFENPLVDFTVFDAALSPKVARSANRALKTLYADAKMSLSTWGIVIAQVENPGIQIWDEADKSWGVTISIRYMIGK